jgi:hypothetical protein
MPTELTDLGFTSSYEIDINPEYPAAGAWGIPEFRLGSPRHGSFRSGEETLTIRIRPSGASPWVASFAVLASVGLVRGLFACPNANHLVVAVGTNAYLIDVTQPGNADDLPVGPVVDVQRPSDTDLLVIGSFTNLAAVDDDGLRWVTGQLFQDDLDLVEGPPGKIYVRGSVHSPGDLELLVLEPSRGDLIEGPRYTDFAHPRGEPAWRRPGI